jgi:hypothetical protein
MEKKAKSKMSKFINAEFANKYPISFLHATHHEGDKGTVKFYGCDSVEIDPGVFYSWQIYEKIIASDEQKNAMEGKDISEYWIKGESPGFKSWDEFPADLKNHPMFNIVTGALEDPLECAPSWLRDAMNAMEGNKNSDGAIWKSYCAHDELTYGMIRAAMSAHKRHTQTSYDSMLRNGTDRDQAREAAKWELE